ncbi:MAG: HlyD family efflux transporter periplasmic adaptor subunit [Oscillospiraceae bacterium]|nr:HlyD family efflux transporter periplasmic adaptor subunit [Oscillospiraceae bacterium]
MDVQEKSKKRELIKTIAIIFLVIMLLLTFFSQTIMNHSLPEVATQVVQSGTINAKIRGSGTVAANESYEVVMEQTREVRSVCVKAGDTVEEGTLLFVMGDMESQEMKDAQNALQEAELAYQKQILTFSKTYAENDLKVKNLRLDLEKAIHDRDTNKVSDTEISYAKGNLASAKTQQSQLELLLGELKAAQESSEEYTEAKSKVDELNNKIKELETAADGYREQLGELNTTGEVNHDKAISTAQTALDTAQSALSAAQAELNAAQTTLNTDYIAYRDTYNSLIAAVRGVYPDASESDRTQLKSYIEAFLAQTPEDTPGLTDWQNAYNVLKKDEETIATKQAAVSEKQADVRAKQTALQEARADASNADGTADSKRQNIQNKLDKAQADLSAAQSQLRDAQARLDAASSANSQLKEQIKVYESSKREQDAAVTELDEKLKELEKKQEVYKAAVETVDSKQRELEEALSGKDISQQMDNLDLESQRLKIEQQRELVAKYQADTTETEIKSKVAGVVKSINVTAGKDTKPGEAMAVIDVVDRGFTIKVSVTNEQAKQVKIGDAADVSNYYWGNDIQATLEAITADPEGGGQKRLLVFRITGDIEAGTNISLSIGQRSANYDTIIPKSALREDTNGNFVLVVTSKSTPLGNRYTATRADVQVLAQDDNNAAVSGLAANDYVITTSSKPLDAGTQVRMVENPS